jgi:hypothetical protein
MSDIQALTDAARKEESDAMIVEEMRNLACKRFGRVAGHLWLLTPNPHFNGEAPIDVVDAGYADAALKATQVICGEHAP